MGLILAVVSLPLIANRIKPNPFYGFRVRRTLEDPEVWYKVNHYAGIQLFYAGLMISITAVGLPFIPNMSFETYSLASTVLLVVIMTVALIRSGIYLKSIGKSDENN
jgi:uncharacterized membrane protein